MTAYRAKWKGPADPPPRLLELTACTFKGSLEDAQAEALALLGVVLEECCHPEDGAPCADCQREAERRAELADENRECYRERPEHPLAYTPRRGW